jgi:hypothetical protein
MKPIIILCAFLIASGCASSPVGKPCDIDAAGQQQAMENIRLALLEDPEIRAEHYLNDEFAPRTIYNGSDYCTFIIQPWTPVVSELIWDGTLGFRINKQTFEVEEILRIDEQ